jgi:hypothetical protein
MNQKVTVSGAGCPLSSQARFEKMALLGYKLRVLLVILERVGTTEEEMTG